MGISIWNLLIIAVIVALVFGTSRLRNVGKDLGEAVKGFKDAVDDGEKEVKESQKQIEDSSIIESEAVNTTEEKEEQK